MFSIDDLIGVPYIEGGRTPQGYDCWGLVAECMRRMEIELPDPFLFHGKESIPKEDWAAWIYQQFGHWKRIEKPVLAAVVVFANKDGIPDHAGVMIDEHRFIHAVKKVGVTISRLDKWPYKLIGAYEYRRA